MTAAANCTGAGSAAEQYPGVARVYDVKHKMALLLKKELESDPRWDAFITQSTQTKRQVTQTELAFLLPRV